MLIPTFDSKTLHYFGIRKNGNGNGNGNGKGNGNGNGNGNGLN